MERAWEGPTPHVIIWPDGYRTPCACAMREDHPPEQTRLTGIVIEE